jgi:hypothetical protein
VDRARRLVVQANRKTGMWTAIVLVVGVVAVWLIVSTLMRNANKR